MEPHPGVRSPTAQELLVSGGFQLEVWGFDGTAPMSPLHRVVSCFSPALDKATHWQTA